MVYDPVMLIILTLDRSVISPTPPPITPDVIGKSTIHLLGIVI